LGIAGLLREPPDTATGADDARVCRAVILLTGLYHDPDAGRRAEFIECVRRNASNPHIEEIHVFVEDGSHPQLDCPKIKIVPHGRRLTYQDLFAYANRFFAGRSVIIANADIFFDGSLARLTDYELVGRLICLSRWDIAQDGTAHFFDHALSQDAWIFQAPMRDLLCEFPLGVPGCDNRLAWEAARAGLALSNPSRSIRALHLHLSQVRRYTERERLPGSVTAVPSCFLGTPWLWFVVPCMGRLGDLRRTIDSMLGQPCSSYILVDYASPDGAGAWVKEHRPQARVVTCGPRSSFHGAEARNLGAALADGDAILCFLDADVRASPGFSRHVLANFEPGCFLAPDCAGKGLRSALVCSKRDFDRAGGFDEAFLDWGQEVRDLRASLRRAGLVERSLPDGLLSHIVGEREPPHSAAASRGTTLTIHSAYRQVKNAIVAETADFGPSNEALREIYQAIACRRAADKLRTQYPCAKIAFRESMGYTVARLKAGASSHNNDLRPFTDIPESLAGRLFTQVVACSASPVEVEFLTAGKLYVLVGTDWDGYHVATAWLRQAGSAEPMRPVQTRRGTGFEVWSVLGESGDLIVLPTQVMLVADELEER
jgi:hypothetical protein